MAEPDSLDLALLQALREHPRAGALQLSRVTGVARATVQARLDRMEKSGVITGYGPDVDLAAAGFPVRALVTLEITQGALDRVAADLEGIPGVLEAYAITGSADVVATAFEFAKRLSKIGSIPPRRSPGPSARSSCRP